MNYNSREDEYNNRDRMGNFRPHARPRDGIDMDVASARQGQSNRQWGADRYESNPYGSRNFEGRGRQLSDDRDQNTQDSTHRTGFMDPYNMGRHDFENRDYNFNDYNGNDWRREQESERREQNDRDYGAHQAPDHQRGYQNYRSRYNNNFFASGDRSNFAGGQGRSGSSHFGNELWSHRMSGQDLGGGMSRTSSGNPNWGQPQYGQSTTGSRSSSTYSQGHTYGQGSNQSYGQTYGQNYGQSQSQASHRDFSDRGYDDNQLMYDKGRFTTQYQHDRELFGSIPGFGSTRGEHFGKGPKGYKRADARIHEEVCDALYHDPNVDASDIEVSVKDGIVTLSGSVPERRMKRMAEECVEHLSGVQDVRNQISGGGLLSRLFESDKSSSTESRDLRADRSDKTDKTDKSSKSNMM